jgi:hypothetical protein
MDQIHVDGCKNYQIKRLNKFETTYKALLKNHYHKNRQDLILFEKMFQSYLANLENDPCSKEFSDEEQFPNGTAEQGYFLRKKRWRNLPGLRGVARFGRLIFLVCNPKKVVYLMWIYTHADHSDKDSGPPDKALRVLISEAKEKTLTELQEQEIDPDLFPSEP